MTNFYHRAPTLDLFPMILSAAALLSFGIAPQYETAVQFRRRNSNIALGSIAAGNRHGGAHEHGREIARRRRQAERRAA